MKKDRHLNLKNYSERMEKSLSNNSNETKEDTPPDISKDDYIFHRNEVSGKVLSVSEKWYNKSHRK